MIPGNYEPLKTMNMQELLCHDNPNCIIISVTSSGNTYVINMSDSMCFANIDVQEVEIVTISIWPPKR